VYLSAIAIRVYYGQKASPVIEKNFWKRWKKIAEQEGKLSAVLWSILSIFWISFMLLYVILNPELIMLFAIPLPIWLRWIGVGLGVVAILLLFWIHQTIGEYWIAYLDLRENHQLVTNGPYRWVRHPMYSQSIILLTALSLVSANLLMMLCSVITIILIFNRIPKEERMMIERFGEEHRDYMKHTGRLLPRFIRKAD
jgi:protein-S-isoprenylcysteine O-methyltransferase Ste14